MKLASKNAKTAVKNTPHGYLIPSIIAMGFIPLIVCYYQFDTMMEQFDWYPNSAAYQADVYLAVKSFAIIFIAAVMVIMLLYRHFGEYEELPWKKLFWLPVGYGILVFLSGIVSKYRAFAFGNSANRFEGVFVVLSYLVIAYYTYSVVKTEDDFWYILKGVSIFVLIEYVICIFQGFGPDFMMSPIGKMMQLPPSRWGELNTVSKSLEPGYMYGTLYAQDFASVYFGLFFPIYLFATFAAKGKQRIFWAIMVGLNCIILVIEKRTGMDSLLVALLGGTVIVLWILSWRNKKVFIIYTALLCVGALVFFNSDKVQNKIKTFLNNGNTTTAENYSVKGVDTDDDEVVFHLSGNREMHLTYTTDDSSTADGALPTFTVKATDEDGNEIVQQLTDEATQTYSVTDDRYAGIQFVLDPIELTATDANGNADTSNTKTVYAMNVIIDGKTWTFMNTFPGKEDSYYYVNDASKLVKIAKNDSESANIFPNTLFTDRGGFWNRIIPMLRHTVILGYGPSTFMCVFQDHTYIFRKYYSVYVAKAHSFYFEQLLESGWIATGLIVAFFLAFVLMGARIMTHCSYKGLLKNGDDHANSSSAIHLGLYFSLIVYMIIILANDSMTVTGPVFWTIFGLLAAFTSIMKKRLAEEDKNED
ncbi:MAG: O-antigen ligase family protein [Candidatus Weimeria sp.]